MNDIVRSDNYIQYLEYRIQRLYERWDARKQEYADAKLRYENKRLAKFFGWKFENSSSWFTPDADDEYAPTYNSLIMKFQAEIRRINYQRAMGVNVISFNSEEFHIGSFYKFCEENGLP